MSNSSIILISDDKRATEIILSKVNLLREADTIVSVNYIESKQFLENSSPDLIMLYADPHSAACFDVIDNIRCNPILKQVPILLICEKVEQDFILTAFDSGIFDFTTIDATDSEVLMRVIWCLKKSLILQNSQKTFELLEELNVVSKDNGFYTHDYVKVVFERAIKKALREGIHMSFIILSTDIDCKYKLSTTLLSSILRKIIRESDVVGVKDDDKFYILLTKTRISGVHAFHSRLMENLSHDYTVSIGAVEVDDDDFDKLERVALEVLNHALKKSAAVVAADERVISKKSDWMDDQMTMPTKNFKLFKQSFVKKLNNVIAPVFFQMQKAYEPKLFDTKIDQVCSEEKIVFLLKKDYNTSKLRITYPGFSKINIDISHTVDDEPQNDRISLNLTEVDSEKMTVILEKFIKEFKRNANA